MPIIKFKFLHIDMRNIIFLVILFVASVAQCTAKEVNSDLEIAKNEKENITSASVQALNVDSVDVNTEYVSYEGTQVWSIPILRSGDIEMKIEENFGAQMWSKDDDEYQFIARPEYVGALDAYLREANITKSIVVDNLQDIIDEERKSNEEILRTMYQKEAKEKNKIWIAYHRLRTIYKYMDRIANEYSEICTVKTIGESVHSRPLKVLVISNGNEENPHVWIDATMHAREWITTTSILYVIDQLLENWGTLPDYLTETNWHIMPIANPDGYDYSHVKDRLWRKNRRIDPRSCDGVDLNRNFGFKWGRKGSSSDKCSITYRGPKAFSEPESTYIAKYVLRSLKTPSNVGFITVHSFAGLILYPWGFSNAKYPKYENIKKIAIEATQAIKKSTGAEYAAKSAFQFYPISGASLDWAKGIAGINHSFLIELRKYNKYKFILPTKYIEPNAKDTYAAVETIVKSLHDS